MQEENVKADLKKRAILYGVILGAITFIAGILSLILSKTTTSIATFIISGTLLNFAVSIAVACYFAVQLRKSVGGYWDFSTALKNIFIVLAMSAIVSTVALTVYNMIDPSLQRDAIENSRNVMIEMLESLGTPDDQIDAALADIDTQLESLDTFSPAKTIQALFISLILYFVLALILAAIFKREKPVFVRPAEESAHPWQDNNNQPPSV